MVSSSENLNTPEPKVEAPKAPEVKAEAPKAPAAPVAPTAEVKPVAPVAPKVDPVADATGEPASHPDFHTAQELFLRREGQAAS